MKFDPEVGFKDCDLDKNREIANRHTFNEKGMPRIARTYADAFTSGMIAIGEWGDPARALSAILTAKDDSLWLTAALEDAQHF